MSAIGSMLGAAAILTLPGVRPRLPSLRRGGLVVDPRLRRPMPMVGVAIVGTAIAGIGGLYVLAATAIVAGTWWKRRQGRKVRARQRAEVASLVAGLETVIGELRVGAHPAIACGVAAEDCIGSVAAAFGRASGRARLGGTAYDGFLVPDSPVSDELARLSLAWRVADEHGLALVGLLAAARGDLLARSRFRDRTQAALAGARATGTVLAALPAVGVLLGQAMGAAPLGVLLGGGLGGVLSVVGAALVCAGLVWTDAITDRVCR